MFYWSILKIRTIIVDSATLPTQLTAYQGKPWLIPRQGKCISQWLA